MLMASTRALQRPLKKKRKKVLKVEVSGVRVYTFVGVDKHLIGATAQTRWGRQCVIEKGLSPIPSGHLVRRDYLHCNRQ